MTSLQDLPRDLLIQLALDLDLKDIFRLCQSNRRSNEIICESDTFWRRKLIKDYPNIPREIIQKIKDSKRVYRIIKDTSIIDAPFLFGRAIRYNDTDLINVFPYIFKVSWPYVMIVDPTNEFNFGFVYSAVVLKKLELTYLNLAQNYTLEDLLRIALTIGVDMKTHFGKYSNLIDEAKEDRNRFQHLLSLLRAEYAVKMILIDLIKKRLEEYNQVYPTGTKVYSLYIHN